MNRQFIYIQIYWIDNSVINMNRKWKINYEWTYERNNQSYTKCVGIYLVSHMTVRLRLSPADSNVGEMDSFRYIVGLIVCYIVLSEGNLIV